MLSIAVACIGQSIVGGAEVVEAGVCTMLQYSRQLFGGRLGLWTARGQKRSNRVGRGGEYENEEIKDRRARKLGKKGTGEWGWSKTQYSETNTPLTNQSIWIPY